MSSPINILFFAETIDVNGSSAGKANHAMIQACQACGFSLKVYHFSHKTITISGVQTILIKEKKIDKNYILSRMQRVLQRLTGKNWSKPLENRFGFSFTFKNDVTSMISALRNEKSVDYDMILTLSKGASYRTHAALLKMPQWHRKWLAYVHDPYPFHWYPSPYEWFEAGFQQKEDFFVEVARQANWLGYPSQKLAEWMGSFDKNFEEKKVIIPHQATNKEKPSSSQFPEYFDQKKFSVLHAGNLLKQRDPFPLIKAWKLFLEAQPAAKKCAQLLLLGPASYHEPTLTNACAAINSIYRSDGYVAFGTVRALEQQVSVNIVLEAASEMSPFLPAKVPGLVQADRTILHLGPKNSETRRLLGESYPFSVAADAVEQIARNLNNLYKIWLDNPEKLKLNRSDLDAYFSPSALGDTLGHILAKQEKP